MISSLKTNKFHYGENNVTSLHTLGLTEFDERDCNAWKVMTDEGELIVVANGTCITGHLAIYFPDNSVFRASTLYDDTYIIKITDKLTDEDIKNINININKLLSDRSADGLQVLTDTYSINQFRVIWESFKDDDKYVNASELVNPDEICDVNSWNLRFY